MAGPQKGAEAQRQTILFLDESGFYPLPSVVRPDAPIGQTPILREWWTRDHLSAISAISPDGKWYFRCQDHALNSEAGVSTDLLYGFGRIIVQSFRTGGLSLI
jgi:hypothetical protein